MSGFARFDLIETSIWTPRALPFFPPPLAMDELEVEEDLGFALGLLNPNPSIVPFDLFEISSSAAIQRLRRRSEAEHHLQSLSDRVAALELGFRRAPAPKIGDFDRKYTWTAEIKGERVEQKYKWTAEAKAGEEKSYTWRAEIKGKGKEEKIYTFKASTAVPKDGNGKVIIKEEKKKKNKETEEKKKVSGSSVKLVEIEEANPGAIAIKKAFAKYHSKGKRKDLSPQEAAMIIQVNFRAHLVRRSQALRCLRDLATAKAKLKEIRSLFYSFSYRRRVASDAEERQRFSEKIIVLLLTVDAIEGPDYMVRAARRSMIEVLESMLEAVEPQASGKLGSMKRRQFDLPGGGPIPKDMAMRISEVVQMLDEEDHM
ncbi:BAG family molecular chaperone regulator 7 [Iris pallida]|uniref:BAG family molecular chaperone regulator 7 n=1 Tax=Iris pallida TaxID=29817 RepID=A0AAX6ID36_IRIPA|nr:BAG family molecular chaperone regulator 7 [Iris pallida]